jgi:hypothetical protein
MVVRTIAACMGTAATIATTMVPAALAETHALIMTISNYSTPGAPPLKGVARLPTLPNTPTFAELGLPQVPGQSTSMNVRAGTPRAAMDKLYAAAVFALSQPDVKAQFSKLQSEISIETPDVAARKLAQQAKMFGDVARRAGIQPQ